VDIRDRPASKLKNGAYKKKVELMGRVHQQFKPRYRIKIVNNACVSDNRGTGNSLVKKHKKKVFKHSLKWDMPNRQAIKVKLS